ncbi:MAG: hypothetical protein RDV48_05105 [Candidatus Eremiobacteraeota bacterium]|nr:hypothetical protein [Candidatus Eremiobacteraeota bacterium]
MHNNDEKCIENEESTRDRYGTKIPVRIKSGFFTEENLHIITQCEEKDIPLSQIEYVCLGAIEELVGGAEAPKSNVRSVIRKFLFGEKTEDEHVKPTKRTLFIVDIYVKGLDAAYRFDSSNINYKSFLGEVSYISFHNFKRLFKTLVDHTKESFFNKSAVALLMKRQDKITRYPSVYDFELECQNRRTRLSDEIHWKSLGEQIDYLFKDQGQIEDFESDDEIPEGSLRVIEGIPNIVVDSPPEEDPGTDERTVSDERSE